MLLTWLLSQYTSSNKNSKDSTEIYAITIDHKYRPESTEEASRISSIVKPWGINHVIRSLDYDVEDVKQIGNFEEVARMKRYDEFRNVCHLYGIPALFIGHHADDQLETFIQRLQGNSSIYGLAGTRKISRLPVADLPPSAKHDPVYVFRPFWNFEKQEIVNTCKQNNIQYFDDPTNQDINLTRRNYLRHLINEVIPERIQSQGGDKQSPYYCIHKSNLKQTHHLTYELAESFEEKAYELNVLLQSKNQIVTNPPFASLKVTIPRCLFINPNEIVLARFFYQILYPFSSSKHYHWAYAKLERQFLPKVISYLQKNESGTLKLTIMNCCIEITNNVHTSDIPMYIYRCPITTKEIESICYTIDLSADQWSDWKLFDRRVWLRFKNQSLDQSIKIIPYLNKKHKPILSKDIKPQITQACNSLPCVLDIAKQEIIAFPTLNIGNTIESEWSLKDNKYEYCRYKKLAKKNREMESSNNFM
ncbi:uncharacterized protein J8A68_002177 [[Candida] subhashii]|uniref:tRNA(Ile)-lysidine synthetase n=1 Tax=[Candida] subhashii TaxID=561895 RepID=A0A8J5UQT0_9ASCO|nr:uncharacterized protein J8A68_002177 [[Candida] subhashii]KAG7664262.1 hypothetical protein J8A68_002177 [[Candida] subhashii]